MGELLRASEVREPPLLVRVGLGARRRRRVAARRRRRDEERRREQRRRRRGAEETDFVERDAALSGAEREKGQRRIGLGPYVDDEKDDDGDASKVAPVGKGDKGAPLSDVGFKPVTSARRNAPRRPRGDSC